MRETTEVRADPRTDANRGIESNPDGTSQSPRYCKIIWSYHTESRGERVLDRAVREVVRRAIWPCRLHCEPWRGFDATAGLSLCAARCKRHDQARTPGIGAGVMGLREAKRRVYL